MSLEPGRFLTWVLADHARSLGLEVVGRPRRPEHLAAALDELEETGELPPWHGMVRLGPVLLEFEDVRPFRPLRDLVGVRVGASVVVVNAAEWLSPGDPVTLDGEGEVRRARGPDRPVGLVRSVEWSDRQYLAVVRIFDQELDD